MNTSTALTPARDGVMGSVFLASGVTFVLGVLNPAVIGSWGDPPGQALAAAAGHKAAWYAPAWTGVVFLVAAVLLFGQYAAFLGALPFPQFLAFAALGAALLARRGRNAGAALDPVFAHGISLREPAGPADIDLEEVE